MSKLFEQLKSIRGVDDDFLNPKYDDLIDPFLLPDMDKAVFRILTAAKNRHHILIYGDYDVDGITSSTLMEDALRLSGIDNIDIMLPDRFADGYGMSAKIIDFAKSNKVDLVITVDCGSMNKEIVQKLNDIGIDTIITDHHECPDDLPDAVAVINPKRKDFEGFRDFAGVGVAFKVAQALVKRGLIKDGQEKWLLDLVLIGTICDSMPLIKENRILCFYGQKVLNKTRRAGLIELMSGLKIKKINSEVIGFQIGPRLNAAGRIESAEIALKLFRTKSRADAILCVNELEELNKRRKTEQQNAINDIEKNGINNDKVIIKVGDWHEGILGIVAGKLVENYKRPAFVLSETCDGVLKGSGRSFGDFKLSDALDYCRDLIIGGGGHAYAAGVKIKKDNVDDFCKKINEYYKKLNLIEQEKYLSEHEDLCVENFDDFSVDFLDELETLEPFGEGNAEPVFLLKDVEVSEVRKMGADEKHLSITVYDGKKNFRLIAFYAPDDWFNFNFGDHINILIHVISNEWNGIRSIEGRILDIF